MDQLKHIMHVLQARWSTLHVSQRRVALWSVLAFVVLGGTSAWWSTRTDWRTLFRSLDGRDAAQVQQELASAGIPFQTSTDGASIEVAAENLDKARVAVAAKGMPQSGRLGFELFDKPNWAGSEFDDKVNYQRALEGELEHTIGTMDAVRAARVHLVLPTRGAFSAEDQPAKASVVLTLRHSVDARTEGTAMRALVASAVEGLTPSAVTLVDADAHVDFAASDAHSASREEEVALQQKLIALLEPLAGAGNVRATVNVSYHTGSEERTDETFDPEKSVPTSTQRTEQSSQVNRPGGVAGTASNTPGPTQAVTSGPANSSNSPAAGTNPSGVQTQSNREESTNFAVTRHTAHSEEGPGRVRRITAAVVINDRPVAESRSKQPHTVWKARTPEEMKRLQQIAQAAVGFESSRGDEVIVQNVAFSGNGDAEVPTGFAGVMGQGKDLLRSQPSLLRSVVIGVSLLALGLLVLRPLGRQAATVLALPQGTARIENAQLLLGDEGGAKPLPEHVANKAPDVNNEASRLLEQVAARVQADPRQSTRLVQSWLSTSMNGEAGTR